MKKFLSVITSVILTIAALSINFNVTTLKLYAEESAAASTNNFEDSTLSEYHISTAQDLVDFNNSKIDFKDKKVYLDADINMKGIDWTPNSFSGFFDGQYHTIKNLEIHMSNSKVNDCYSGLFSNLYGTVVRLNLEDYYVTAEAHSEGNLYPPGTSHSSDWDYWIDNGGQGVIRIYNYDGYAGGICCINNGRIYGCTANGTSGVSYSYYNCPDPSRFGSVDYGIGKYEGGICAVNNGAIKYCSSSESIYGDNSGIILNCEPDYQWTHEEVDVMDFTDDAATLGELIVSPESIEIYEGFSKEIDARINNFSVNAKYQSQNTDIATVESFKDIDYYIKGKSAGDTQIKITYGSQTKYIDVHVSEIGELVVSPETISIAEGESQQINVTMNNASVDAKCDVADSTIAGVYNNIVTGKSYGDTQIKVTFCDQTKYIDVHVYGNIKAIPANDFSDMSAEEFRITTADGLYDFIRACQNNSFYGKTVYLDADIELNGRYTAPDYFNGTFDGRNHTISGISVTVGVGGSGYDSEEVRRLADQNYKGDYDCYGGGFVNQNSGTICRLKLENLDITAVSYTFANLNMDDMSLACNIAINPHVGYICGKNYGTIVGCTANGVIHEKREWSPADSWMCNDRVYIDDTQYWAGCESIYPSKYPLTEQSPVKGDINDDGKFTVSDVVTLQRWLLAVPDAKLNNWKAGDLCEDDMLNVFDLCLMKRELVSK